MLSDVTGRVQTLHIANNAGASSSIFPMDQHKDVWPDVEYVKSHKFMSRTLDDVLCEQHNHYDALVIDTQGAELLVLRGATESLRHFRFVKAEVCDFSAYAGGCTAEEVNAYLRENGFRLRSKRSFAQHPNGGTYMDVVYDRS